MPFNVQPQSFGGCLQTIDTGFPQSRPRFTGQTTHFSTFAEHSPLQYIIFALSPKGSSLRYSGVDILIGKHDRHKYTYPRQVCLRLLDRTVKRRYSIRSSFSISSFIQPRAFEFSSPRLLKISQLSLSWALHSGESSMVSASL
jgi:hypothetical protein